MSSERLAATPRRTRFTQSPYWRLRPIDAQFASHNSRYVNRCTGDNDYPTIHAGPKLRLSPGAMAVVAMTSNGFSIADPDDGGMLDVVGFNASAPQVIADFADG